MGNITMCGVFLHQLWCTFYTGSRYELRLPSAIFFKTNSYVTSFQYGGRAPLNSAYSALLSEYGLILIAFIILFHGSAFKFKSIEDILEITIICGLFLGYPLAYPYFWFVLGIIHLNRQNNISNKIRLKYIKPIEEFKG